MEKATNGQFREFFGKLIVKVNDEKIAITDKVKIQSAINALSSTTDDYVTDNVIRFINNGCRLQIVGNHTVNTDLTPTLPFSGATIEVHKKRGMVAINPSAITLHLSPNQKDGKVINGHDLRKELKGKPVMDACELDYLLANPHLIPEEWKGKAIFFWGTIFRDSDGSLCVRFLIWHDGRWQSFYSWLDGDWDGDNPAALSA